jgi:hypothetical protein
MRTHSTHCKCCSYMRILRCLYPQGAGALGCHTQHAGCSSGAQPTHVHSEIRPEHVPVSAVQGVVPDTVKALRDPLVAATIDIYTAASTALLPTPAKSHYLFNLRDVSRVVHGILLMPPEALAGGGGGGDAAAKAKMTRLWVHETLRVFYDRCVLALVLAAER